MRRCNVQVQVEPGLYALRVSSCKLKYESDVPAANFAFNFNLRPYTQGRGATPRGRNCGCWYRTRVGARSSWITSGAPVFTTTAPPPPPPRWVSSSRTHTSFTRQGGCAALAMMFAHSVPPPLLLLLLLLLVLLH